ncbi:MAG: MFS transporter [Desulfobulbus sp.]|nr:MFS transporter [Desulfobulbus sp.]
MTREERHWVLYDVANSAFVLVMVTAIMPIYFKDVMAAGQPAHIATANWGFANAGASLVLALLAPVLGAMADYPGRKKMFFAGFLGAGIFFNLTLPAVPAGHWMLCLLLFVLARVGWAGANIFYDAFLVDVTTPDRMDQISARGYAYGYIGSVLPFLAVIGLIFTGGGGDTLPIGPARTGFVLIGLWWLVFSLPAVITLRQVHALPVSPRPFYDSFRRIGKTMHEIRRYPQAFLFLLAYFFYIDGVDTIITMATAYGRDLGFSIPVLIAVLLFIQLVAFPFALIYGRLASRYSAKTMLMTGILLYCLVTVCAFFLPKITDPLWKNTAFWGIAFLVASAMGGIQALSRSFFGRLIPPEKSAEFFGFYNVCGKFAAITGPFLMGMVGRLAGDTRWGVLSLLFLFGIGALILSGVHEDRVMR